MDKKHFPLTQMFMIEWRIGLSWICQHPYLAWPVIIASMIGGGLVVVALILLWDALPYLAYPVAEAHGRFLP